MIDHKYRSGNVCRSVPLQARRYNVGLASYNSQTTHESPKVPNISITLSSICNLARRPMLARYVARLSGSKSILASYGPYLP